MDGEEGGNQRRVERGGGFERRHRTREAAGAIGARSRRTIFDARRRLISSLSSDSDSDELEEEDFRDAKSIIELLKENLTLWKEEDDDNAIDDL